MPLMPIPTGNAVAQYFISNAPPAGTPVGVPTLQAIWAGAMAIIDQDIKDNATITFAAADIQVPALGLIDSMSAPVTGTANSAPFTKTGKIS